FIAFPVQRASAQAADPPTLRPWTGVIKSESHCACILTTEGASYLALPGVENHFLLRSASLRASPSTRCFAAHLEGRLCGARKRAFSFLTQHLRASVCAKPRPR